MSDEKEKKWERVQIRAFTSWFNQAIGGDGRVIEDLGEDLKDGVLLNTFLEAVSRKKLQRWQKTPKLRAHKIENASIAINFITKDLGVRLVGIGAEDICDGNLKLILGLLWSLFRKLNIESISQEGKSSEDGLLLWLQKMTEGYNGVNIVDFKDSFSDGLAFSALVNAFDEKLLDYSSIDHGDAPGNLNSAFDIAETQIGIPKLLDVEDMLAGGKAIDERSVILYCSLFFHAFVANEERRKLDGEKNKIANKMTDLEAQLAASLAENEELRNRNKELEDRIKELEQQHVAEAKAKLADYEERLRLMQDEINYLRERLAQEMEMRLMLEDKIKALEALLKEQSSSNSMTEEERARLRNEISELRARAEKLNGDLAAVTCEKSDLTTSADERERSLREVEERRNRLEKELQELRERIAREIAARKAQAAEIERLRKELERMRQREIVQGQARIGLDVLKRNLEEHLEDLYRWRDLNDEEFKDTAPDFDLAAVINTLENKSFEDQLTVLDDKLQEENRSLRRILTLKDSDIQLKDTVLKEGALTMKGRKEWKQRWFKLVGNYLNYYEEKDAEDIAGKIPLDQGCDVVRQKAVKDETSPKKLWPLKITVGDRKLFVRAATKKERHSWFLALTSKISHINYIKECEGPNARPDTRVINLFAAEKCPQLHLDGKPLDKQALTALSKGLPGRDEVETLSIVNAGLDDDAITIIGDVLGKMAFKVLKLGNNKLGDAAVATIAGALAQNAALLEIHLNDNQIGDAGVAALCEKLSGWPELVALNLSGNKITAAGAKSLAEAAGSAAIPALQLSNNNLGDDGAAAAAELVGKNTTISTIELAGNSIGDAGASALAGALNSAAVTTVDLSNNKIGAAGAVAVKNAFQGNAGIASINLSGNSALSSGDGVADLMTGDGIAFPNFSLARA